jgi:hypothetical protein
MKECNTCRWHTCGVCCCRNSDERYNLTDDKMSCKHWEEKLKEKVYLSSNMRYTTNR